MSTFLTQPRVNLDDYPTDDMGELEALVSGVTQTSQSTLLLKKRKEMREVDDALDFMKEEFQTRMDACEERQKEFERKQTGMKEQVAKFEKFIQENDAKRQRAEMKAKNERKALEQNEAKIKQLNEALNEDKKSRHKSECELEKLKKYQEYLDSAVDFSGEEYEEIGDILNRYKTLVDANVDLKRIVEIGEKDMDELRQKLTGLRRENQNTILVQNSEIHGHQKKVETLRSEGFQLNSQRERDEMTTNNLHRESGQVVMSIKNLYTRCLGSMHSKVPAISEKDMEPQVYMEQYLKVIRERIIDLKDIAEGNPNSKQLFDTKGQSVANGNSMPAGGATSSTSVGMDGDSTINRKSNQSPSEQRGKSKHASSKTSLRSKGSESKLGD
jgi:chromosome segregation ATPase